MQNSLLPKEDAHPSSPFLNEELEEIFFKKNKISKSEFLKGPQTNQRLQEPHTAPGDWNSNPPASSYHCSL